ncbi:MAG: YkgJ family cysteine cluster protein [Candidatus Omnitrophica bacterium]|nr:YkgJ family cysteine cluster protein [Candidatus Omnitrophota bacterium]
MKKMIKKDSDNMNTDLYMIAQLAKEKELENQEFYSFLKSNQDSKKIDKIVRSLYKQISAKIDCTSCGNCCKLMDPVFKKEDIEKLGPVTAESIKKDLREDKKENGFIFKISPCSFFKDKKCLQYLFRPVGCRSYPHLCKENFISRFSKVMESYSICPIVFNVCESLKIESRYI